MVQNFDISKIKGIVFDMDGVLLDSESICDYAWKIAAKEQQITDISMGLEKCRGTSKKGTVELLQNLYPAMDVALFMQRTHDLFYEIEAKNGIALMPYAKEALEDLSKKYILALASSTRMQAVHRQMTNAGIISYFSTLTTGDMVAHAKPDPEIYISACKSINLGPQECIAVEDSPNGITSAYKAGLYVVMIPDKIPANSETDKMTIATLQSLRLLVDMLM